MTLEMGDPPEALGDELGLLRAEPDPDGLGDLPGRVVRWYAVVGASWIVASDLFLVGGGGPTATDRLPDLLKGLGFIAATTVLLYVVLRRITRAHRKAFAEIVTRQRDFYRSVVDTSSDVVAIFDADERLVYVNAAAGQLLGWRPEDLLGRTVEELVHPDDRAALVGFLENLTDGGASRSARIFAFKHADGSHRLMELSGTALAGSTLAGGVVVNARDVTDRVRSERQLRAALAADVTGLPNLRAYAAELAVLEEIRSTDASVTALLVDVDRFADVNALHGRDAGDVVLREVARRLEAAVPQAVGVWHCGVDEFLVVLLDQRDGPAEAGGDLPTMVERVRGELGAPIVLPGIDERVRLDFSVGVSSVRIDGGGSPEPLGDRLLRSAEAAVAAAKGHPDRVSFRLAAREEGSARARMVAELREAIPNGELVVHYQPKVRLLDGVIVGAEALVRWQHPERGLLQPGAFLPAVAAANLSGSLTSFVLHDALAQLGRWRAQGCARGFAVSVNASLDDLRRAGFVADVFAALERCSASASQLTLEITEQVMLADPVGAREKLEELRRAGVQIAIDDFGTGFSALEHIRMFTVDELKIDKSFVQALGDSPTDEAIVESVLAIAARLGVTVTAEGIEDVAALAHLRASACQQGQGFLFDPAVPPATLDPCRIYAVGG